MHPTVGAVDYHVLPVRDLIDQPDRHDLAMVAGLYLRTHLLFIDFGAASSVLFAFATWMPGQVTYSA